MRRPRHEGRVYLTIGFRLLCFGTIHIVSGHSMLVPRSNAPVSAPLSFFPGVFQSRTLDFHKSFPSIVAKYSGQDGESVSNR
jgi:hypothetical protein